MGLRHHLFLSSSFSLSLSLPSAASVSHPSSCVPYLSLSAGTHGPPPLSRDITLAFSVCTAAASSSLPDRDPDQGKTSQTSPCCFQAGLRVRTGDTRAGHNSCGCSDGLSRVVVREGSLLKTLLHETEKQMLIRRGKKKD